MNTLGELGNHPQKLLSLAITISLAIEAYHRMDVLDLQKDVVSLCYLGI